MTERLRRSHSPRHPRIQAAAVLTILSLAAITALAPVVLAGGTTIVVTTIPGGGWANSIDNTAGGTTQLVPFVEPDTLGNGALQLTVAANTDSAALAHPLAIAGIPASDVTASFRTFVTGDTGNPDSEPASLRFTGYQNGLSTFTTLVVELVYNGGVTADVWQDTALTDETVVWQTTNNGDNLCQDVVPLCTFAEYKEHYQNARFIGVQVGVGSGVPAVTTWADGVSLTIDGVTETFDFDVVAAPTAAPTVAPPDPAPATAVPTAVPVAGGLPNTATPSQPGSGLGIALGSLVVLSAVTTAVVWRRRLSR